MFLNKITNWEIIAFSPFLQKTTLDDKTSRFISMSLFITLPWISSNK